MRAREGGAVRARRRAGQGRSVVGASRSRSSSSRPAPADVGSSPEYSGDVAAKKKRGAEKAKGQDAGPSAPMRAFIANMAGRIDRAEAAERTRSAERRKNAPPKGRWASLEECKIALREAAWAEIRGRGWPYRWLHLARNPHLLSAVGTDDANAAWRSAIGAVLEPLNRYRALLSARSPDAERAPAPPVSAKLDTISPTEARKRAPVLAAEADARRIQAADLFLMQLRFDLSEADGRQKPGGAVVETPLRRRIAETMLSPHRPSEARDISARDLALMYLAVALAGEGSQWVHSVVEDRLDRSVGQLIHAESEAMRKAAKDAGLHAILAPSPRARARRKR